MKTHKVVDRWSHNDKGDVLKIGTFEECQEFEMYQDKIGLEIVTLTKEEIKILESNNSSVNKIEKDLKVT